MGQKRSFGLILAQWQLWGEKQPFDLGERQLFPITVIQMAEIRPIRTAANGQMRTFDVGRRFHLPETSRRDIASATDANTLATTNRRFIRSGGLPGVFVYTV